ncbi:MaoC family dehydratase [Pseudooceanicola nanhaiensis]|jgi:acyl dehydratase|uniref:MaoC family dehydratase n=1 Tax=Pseudooceanicola nanhaiensis TaxID=375761 RepID=A0A917SW43_9RHOB|nr:MaoC family dehydratase [Pseudooceanicola nanhaiensis]GGM00621.1 MaoC family dehydratase [Pseudooceanicola nanhaiensis]
MAGLYFEEFSVGQHFRHELTRSVTESDNMTFSLMSMNPQPLHVDFDFASRTEWGRPLFNSMFTFAIMVGLTVQDTTLGTTIGNLGFSEVTFPAPVFHGDTLRAETTVLSVRESRSRPTQGLVEFEHRCFKQDGTLVAQCKRMALMKKREAA